MPRNRKLDELMARAAGTPRSGIFEAAQRYRAELLAKRDDALANLAHGLADLSSGKRQTFLLLEGRYIAARDRVMRIEAALPALVVAEV